MRRAACGLTAIAFVLSGTALSAQSAPPPLRPAKPIKVQPVQEAPAPRPVIATFRVDDTGGVLSWVVKVENQGTAPTAEGTALVVYRGGDPALNAGGAGVPVIPPGGTATVWATLNPDPRQGFYTLALRHGSQDLHAKPSTLGIPTVAAEMAQAPKVDGIAWTATVRNTWSYSMKEVRVQVFRRTASTAAWERVTEEVLGPLGPGVSRQLSGTGGPLGSEFKSVVSLRRVPAEPWVEMASSAAPKGR